MTDDYNINWKDHPEKRPTLAAAYALTKSWKASTAIWAAQFPDDARGVGDNNKLLRRLQSQYGESGKGALCWSDIPLSLETYRAPDNITGLNVIRVARTLNIQLANIKPRTSHIPPPSPPATPRSGQSSGAPRTPPARVEQPQIPRLLPRLVDRLAEAVNIPVTPSTSRKNKRPDSSAKIENARANQTPYAPISQSAAHPDLESIVFRFYLPIEGNAPFATGFKARRWQTLPGPRPPPPQHTDPRLFADLWLHVNREEVATPFVSVATRLFWTVRQAIKLFLGKKPKRSDQEAIDYRELRICVLDTATIKKSTSIFYVKPYHDQLISRMIFSNGAWMYDTLHEHVAWDYIPKEATICDFSVAELQELCASDDRLDSILRLDTISASGGTGKIHSALNEQVLDAESVAALSRLLVFLFAHRPVKPVDLKRSMEYTKALVIGLMEGWKLRPRAHMSAQEWSALADIFVQGIEGAVGPLQGINRVRFVEAFLQGVRAGFRKWASESTTALERVCTKYGLDDVDAILDSVLSPPVNRFQHFVFEEPPLHRVRVQDARFDYQIRACLISRLRHSRVLKQEDVSRTTFVLSYRHPRHL